MVTNFNCSLGLDEQRKKGQSLPLLTLVITPNDDRKLFVGEEHYKGERIVPLIIISENDIHFILAG